MTHVPDQPHHEHPDVAGETQAWCSKCESDAEDCTCPDSVCSSDTVEANTQHGQAKFKKSLHGFCSGCRRNRWLNDANICRQCSNKPPKSEYDYEDRAEATSEYLDNLPKPPEPIPWLPPKKATNRHPFE